MPISFQCGGCQATLNVAEQYAGKNANCPQCGAAFVVPQPASSGMPNAAPASSPSPEPAGGFPSIATGKKPKRSGSSSSIDAGSAIGPGPAAASNPVPAVGPAPTRSAPAPAPAGVLGASDVIDPGNATGLAAPGNVSGIGAAGHGGASAPTKRRRGGKWLSSGVSTYPILGAFTGTLGVVAFGYYAIRMIQMMSKLGFQFDIFFNAVLLLSGIAAVTVVTSFSCFVAGDYLKSYLSDQ